MRVIIMGNGIVSNLGALYFKKRLPESTEVIIIGPEDRGGVPLVGESIIEITAHFLESHLGLSQYLQENHLPKYALTYYFKLDPDNPDDRTYSVHCNERGPKDRLPLEGWEGPMDRPASWLLNRTIFDRDLKNLVAEHGGIKVINGKVTDVDLNGESGHTVEVNEANGDIYSLKADWVIDATGRNRLLAKKLNLIIKPEGQRDCFWFRLAGFDRSLLTKLNALGPMPPDVGEPYHYDRYYSTHHFLGHGNWIWMIPLKEEDGSDLMSVGLVSHPDYYEYDVRSIESFIEHVSKVHPVVTDFVKSGTVVDTNLLRSYHYVVNPVYSPDRWGIVGDAAFAPDPMFSNGLAFGVIQLEQLGELIAQDYAGNHSAKFVTALSDAFMAPVISSQTAISNWYESMGDTYLSSLRLNWIEVVYFYMFLPLVINRCHYDPDRFRLWKILQFRGSENSFEIPQTLLDARALFDKATPDHFIYKGKEKVNLRALEQVDDVKGIFEQIEDGQALLKEYINDVLERVNELRQEEERKDNKKELVT